jgi:hypothetical protein
MRVDQVDGEAVAEQGGVVSQQARAVAGSAREVQERLARANDLVRGAPAPRQVHGLA